MATEATLAAKRRYWSRRMADPEKHAAYLDYQRRYYREAMSDPVTREYELARRREQKARQRAVKKEQS